ncbi:MAG TPA: SRPBCC family protein, partial [Gemmatimonadaceae bacterium]|nr:SRPBCC family protein [Gemmatimonadaceae bacterium]
IVVTVDIDAPPNEVWAVVCDVEHWPDWTPTVHEATHLDQGPFAVGSRTRVVQPRLRPAVWEVTHLEVGRRFTWVSRSPGIVIGADHVIEPHGSGSRVTLSVHFAGVLGGLIGRMYRRITRRYVGTEAESLRRRCEGARAGGTATNAHV